MSADDKGVVPLSKSPGKLLTQPVCFLRRDLAGDKRLAQMIGNHIICAAHPASLLNVPLFRKQKFRIRNSAVTPIAGDELTVIGFFRVLYIIDNVADGLAD